MLDLGQKASFSWGILNSFGCWILKKDCAELAHASAQKCFSEGRKQTKNLFHIPDIFCAATRFILGGLRPIEASRTLQFVPVCLVSSQTSCSARSVWHHLYISLSTYWKKSQIFKFTEYRKKLVKKATLKVVDFGPVAKKRTSAFRKCAGCYLQFCIRKKLWAVLKIWSLKMKLFHAKWNL